MKASRRTIPLLALLAAVVLAAGGALIPATPAMAQAIPSPQTFGFNACSNRDPANVAVGEAQMKVTIADEGTAPMQGVPTPQISFLFENIGSAASSLTDIYFYDPATRLIDFRMMADSGTGVNFSVGATPNYLRECAPLNAIVFASFDSTRPIPTKGINPGEWLKLYFWLAPGVTYADIANLQIGIYVSAFANQGSEAFITKHLLTYVRLVSFELEPVEGGVLVKWVTDVEVDNAGFNVLRSSTAAGPFERVNPTLIPGQGTGAGTSYTYLDEGGTAAHLYRLEDIDFGGGSTLHAPTGPVAAELPLRLFVPLALAQ
jgi:hypothetical protein